MSDRSAEAVPRGSVTLEQLKDSIEQGSLFPMVKRPGHGKEGEQLSVLTNLYRVSISKLPSSITQYDIRFTLEGKEDEDVFALKRHRELREKIYDALLDKEKKALFKSNRPAWDGNKQLFTAKPLDITSSYTTAIDLARKDEREEEVGGKSKKIRKSFIVIIKFARTIETSMLRQLLNGEDLGNDVDPREIIQALDIALQHAVTGPNKRFTLVGRNLYDRNKPTPTSQGAEIWMGYFQSLRPGEGELWLNFDISAGLFVKQQSALEYLDKECRLGHRDLEANERSSEVIRKYLKNFSLALKHRSRGAFKCQAVTSRGADRIEFEMDPGQKITVKHYFSDHKGIKLKYPEYPCIEVRSTRDGQAFSEFYPLELINIMGGRRYTGKAVQTHVDAIRNLVADRPDKRLGRIQNGLEAAEHNRSSVTEAFNLRVYKEACEVRARKLNPPRITFKDQRPADSRFGAWNARNMKLFRNGGEIENWGIFSFSSKQRADERRFIETMTRFMRDKADTHLPRCLFTLDSRDFRGELKKTVKDMFNEAERLFTKNSKHDISAHRIIFVIIEESDSFTYHEVKKASDLSFGIVTQCVKDNRARECRPPVIENICLKVNAKLGGLNYDCPTIYEDLIKTPTLILGADISHGGAGSRSPSVCALVGNVSKFVSKLSASLSLSPLVGDEKRGSEKGDDKERRLVRKEVVNDMRRMVKERMEAFKAGTGDKSGQWPKRIIYYRDGVADSQFEKVVTQELMEIRKAVNELREQYGAWDPETKKGVPDARISALIHQKRHHVRFFPAKRGNNFQDRKSGNLQHGIVVDRDICHPYGYDFFLLSHPGLQGTSRPSYYRVIIDENNYGPDMLQKITFTLCHTYASCTRAISGVPVCFYADRLAARVRDYCFEQMSDSASQISDSSMSSTTTKLAPLHPHLVKTFFFA